MNLPIRTPDGSYNILLERGALSRAGELLPLERRTLIVTDNGVPASYAAQIAVAAAHPTLVTLEQGEATKCIDSYLFLLSTMIREGFTRGDAVVAVGGGVIGDLAGFAAATYMRGIDFFNVPTTLLSMVDSSVGGKVAIDLEGIKNIVGAFWPPRRVLIDPDVLRTLDARQFRAGLCEAIKMAATSDAALFAGIEQMDPAHPTEAEIDRVIEGALRIKKAVVEEDPTERGLRRVLNFGHTLGHAVESEGAGRYLHGECVAVGMLPMCSPEVRQRLEALLSRWGLPTRTDAAPEALAAYLSHDKKSGGTSITTVHVEQIGSFVFRQETPEELLHALRAETAD